MPLLNRGGIFYGFEIRWMVEFSVLRRFFAWGGILLHRIL